MRKQFVRMALFASIVTALASPAFADNRIRIVSEGGIADEWGLPMGTKLATPHYPEKYAGDPQEICVTIGYLLNADGHTSDYALLKSWSANDNRRRNGYWETFANEAAAAMAQWHFVPRPEVAAPRPVYSVATFVFGSPDPAATRSHCAVPDVPRRLLELRADRRAARMMSRGIYSELAFDPLLENRFQRTLREQTQAESQPATSRLKLPTATPPPPPPPSPTPTPPTSGQR